MINQNDWDNFIDDYQEANFLHSYAWGQFQESLGKKVYRFKVGDLQAQAYVEPARRGKHLIVLGGPIGDWSNPSDLSHVKDELVKIAKENDCVFIRLRPQLKISNTSLVQDLGFKLAPMSLSVEHAGILDLSLSNDEVVAAASQSFRRKLRKAQKLDLEIKVDDQPDPALLEDFYRIHKDHADRQGYVPFTKKFLVSQFNMFAQQGNAKLYSILKDGQVIAQNYIIFSKHEASYHYGVSTSEGVKLSAAPLIHLLAMTDARDRGCSRYNFWGIVDLEQTDHRYYGVSQFKRSFGVQDLKYVPAHDLPIAKYKYKLNYIFETIRKKRRKL